MRVVAVGIGIGAGLLVPWLRHHDDVDPTPPVYVDPPYIAPTASEVEDTARFDPPRVENYAKVHLDLRLPGFEVYDRMESGFSMTGDESYIIVQELADDERAPQKASDVVAHMADLGFDVTRVKPKTPDGRWAFTIPGEDHEPGTDGWIGTKVCGDHAIRIMAVSTSKTEKRQMLAAYQHAKCSDVRLAY